MQDVRIDNKDYNIRTLVKAFQLHANIIQNELFDTRDKGLFSPQSVSRNLRGEGDITLAPTGIPGYTSLTPDQPDEALT
jgi:hypothetical protein